MRLGGSFAESTGKRRAVGIIYVAGVVRLGQRGASPHVLDVCNGASCPGAQQQHLIAPAAFMLLTHNFFLDSAFVMRTKCTFKRNQNRT